VLRTIGQDDQQARWSRPLLPNETGSLWRAAGPAAHCSLDRPGAAGRAAGLRLAALPLRGKTRKRPPIRSCFCL